MSKVPEPGSESGAVGEAQVILAGNGGEERAAEAGKQALPDVVDLFRKVMSKLDKTGEDMNRLSEAMRKNHKEVNSAFCRLKDFVWCGLEEVREEARRHTDDAGTALREVTEREMQACREEISALQLALKEQSTTMDRLQERKMEPPEEERLPKDVCSDPGEWMAWQRDLPVISSPLCTLPRQCLQASPHDCQRWRKPSEFDGKVAWEAYLAQVELLAGAQDWDDNEKALQLISGLRGVALEVLAHLTSQQRTVYSHVVGALQRRFGHHHQAEMYLARLKARVRARGESLPQLAQELETLVRHAYPAAAEDMVTVLTRDYFVDALQDRELQLYIEQAHPEDVQVALARALELEAFLRTSRVSGPAHLSGGVARGTVWCYPASESDRLPVYLLEVRQEGAPPEYCPRGRRTRSLERKPISAFQPCCASCGRYGHSVTQLPVLALKTCRWETRRGWMRGPTASPRSSGPTQCNLSPYSRSNGPYKRNRGWEAMSNDNGYVDTGAEKTIMRPDVLTARDYHEEPRQLCGVTGHCTPLRGPVEARFSVGGSEEVLPVYVAEMEDPCLLGIDYLMQVGACIDLKKWKLRIREKEVPLSLGVAPAEVVMAVCECIASDTEPKVTFELSGKLENHDCMIESIEPLEQADDSEEVTFQKRLPGNEGVVNDISLPDHLTDLARRSAIHLDHQQQERLGSTLTRYADVFSKGDLDLGRTGLVQHHIRTGDALPIKHAPRRIAPARLTKKDGTKRFCVDYRSLNNVTAKDSYPLPRMDDTLDAMAGARWFSTLNLKSGYHQVEMAREDKAKTAFSFGQGLCQFTVMPFGLCNAPSCFERLMERVLEGLQCRTALVYLDDIIVFGGSFDEELERLEVVLRRLRAANFKLSPKKCLFFQSEVPFLGNIVGRDGVKTDPQKVAAVQDWPVPTCVADVKSFVAFDSLKQALVEAPVLPYPDPARSYLLDTNASAEVKSTEHFHPYLYGAKFLIRTDHAALQWLKTLKAPEGQLARWLGRLEQYHYEVQHRPGRVHNNADSLSRRPCEPECQHCLRREERVACRQLQVWGDSVDAEERWRQVQREDDDLTPLIKWMEASPERSGWPQVTAESPVTKHLWQQWAMLRLENGVLQRRWDDARGRPSYWVVLVPHTLRRDLLHELHGGITSGHLGVKRTLTRLRQRFYWVGMRRDVQEWCRTCEVCCARNGPVKKNRAPFQLYQVGAPLERVAVDIVRPFPVTTRGNRFICVVMDYFTKWPEAYALPDHEAETVAEALVNNFITHFGVPCELHSDQGREFESVVFQECCRLLGIKKTRTTALRPQSDGLVERFNRTLIHEVAK
nr:uncharacterized protein LOC113806594 [Penaeus vannamei]